MNEDTKQQEPQGNGVLPCVSGWLEIIGNENIFKEAIKLNCPIRFSDGTQKLYNEYWNGNDATHFKVKW